MADRYEALLGKDDYEELRRKGHCGRTKAVETLLEQADAKYGIRMSVPDGTAGKGSRSGELLGAL